MNTKHLRTIELNSGGELTIRATCNILLLSKDDREFILGLVDALEQYNASKPVSGQFPPLAPRPAKGT